MTDLPPPPSGRPPEGYQYVYQPGFTVPEKRNGLAVASLVCGIVGIVGCFLLVLPVLAVVFGHVALSQIKRSAGRQTGRGQAIAGLVCGYVGIGLIVLWIVLASTSS